MVYKYKYKYTIIAKSENEVAKSTYKMYNYTIAKLQ